MPKAQMVSCSHADDAHPRVREPPLLRTSGVRSRGLAGPLPLAGYDDTPYPLPAGAAQAKLSAWSVGPWPL